MLKCLKIESLFFVLLFVACNNIQRNKSHADVSIKSIERGKTFAEVYCQNCHMLPNPQWADAKSWEKGILPNMGPRLGIFYYNQSTYPSYKFDPGIGKNFYPEQPVLTYEQWQSIIDYYTATSPDTLIEKKEKILNGENLIPFSIEKPFLRYDKPAIAFVKINTADTINTVLASDAMKKMFYCFDKNLKLTDSLKTPGTIVNAEKHNDNWVACDIGVLNPNNGNYGRAKKFTTNTSEKISFDTAILFSGLRRPVQITSADLNNDGKPDYLVCEFGFQKGALSWMENSGSNKYIYHAIRNLPGAIKATIEDYNNDGLPDIWALFTQGEEGIFLFTNKGNGQFETKQVLKFPPIFGSTYFEFADFNKDGKPDILYTCGDNADYSTVLKPYHGVYIYINKGNNQFEQKYFFHINGCYKAVAKDFDKDGNLDIAAISYFADYKNNPEEGFVYLKGNSKLKFTPYSLPGIQTGRWLTMDSGDIDNDGDDDIVLGNFSVAPGFIKSNIDWKKGPPFMVLKNNSK